MATDFGYNNKTIVAGGPIKPNGKDMPIDSRTRVETYADISTIPTPYVGMKITVKADETNNNKMTDYIVKSLKANSAGIANSLIDEVVRYVDYLGVSGGGSGLTSTQLANIAKIPAIQSTVDALPNNYASKNHNHSEYASSSHRHDASEIDNLPSGGGTGLTTEQAQQLQTAYEHSQSTHVTFDDLLNIDVKEVGKKIITGEYSKIVLMGDSITDGYGGTGYNGSRSNNISTNTDGYCWANVFKKYLSEKYSISVSNTGMYGSVISEQMNKINEIITDDTDLVILLTGTNNRDSSSKFNDYKSNLSTHINSLLAKNVDLLVINNIPSTLNDENHKYTTMRDIADVVIKNTYGNVKSFSMYDEFINYCENNNISLSTLFYDHVHPNDDGYLIMFKLLCKNIGLPLSPYDNFSQSSSWWNGSTSTEVYGNIITNTTSLTIDEGSSTTTFTVKLSQAPTSTQQVSLTSNNSDVTLSPNSLSFSSSDYNVTQTVTVTVLEDDDRLNDSAIITLSSNNVTNKTINVTVNDNDNTGEPIETNEIIYSKNSNINVTDTEATFTSSTENFDWFILPSSNSKIKITSATREFWIVLAGDSTKCLASNIWKGTTQGSNCATYKVYESGTGTNTQIAGGIFVGVNLIDYLEYSYSGNIITCTNGTATQTYDISSVVSEFGTPRLGLMCEKKHMPITINYTIE